VDGRPLNVVTTHFGLLAREQAAQADALMGHRWLGAREHLDDFILLGDFNATSGSAAHRRLTARLQDAQMQLPGRNLPTYPSLFPMLRIDHVFVGADVQVAAVEVPATPLAKAASDHLPLVVDFTLRPRRLIPIAPDDDRGLGPRQPPLPFASLDAERSIPAETTPHVVAFAESEALAVVPVELAAGAGPRPGTRAAPAAPPAPGACSGPAPASEGWRRRGTNTGIWSSRASRVRQRTARTPPWNGLSASTSTARSPVQSSYQSPGGRIRVWGCGLSPSAGGATSRCGPSMNQPSWSTADPTASGISIQTGRIKGTPVREASSARV
jgi:hypothetical protein